MYCNLARQELGVSSICTANIWRALHLFRNIRFCDFKLSAMHWHACRQRIDNIDSFVVTYCCQKNEWGFCWCIAIKLYVNHRNDGGISCVCVFASSWIYVNYIDWLPSSAAKSGFTVLQFVVNSRCDDLHEILLGAETIFRRWRRRYQISWSFPKKGRFTKTVNRKWWCGWRPDKILKFYVRSFLEYVTMITSIGKVEWSINKFSDDCSF